jgi:hypothetical protein
VSGQTPANDDDDDDDAQLFQIAEPRFDGACHAVLPRLVLKMFTLNRSSQQNKTRRALTTKLPFLSIPKSLPELTCRGSSRGEVKSELSATDERSF